MDVIYESSYYSRKTSVVFKKNNRLFGGLSNMAKGYPLIVNDVQILACEMLYQACRFPEMPDLQKLIIESTDPVIAKRIGKSNEALSRSDWMDIRVTVMAWCLRIKLAQHWNAFGELLKSTDNLPIVEESRGDDFWGAKPLGNNTLAGLNVLGVLLMTLRDEFFGHGPQSHLVVNPPPINNFLLYGNKIVPVQGNVVNSRIV